LVTLAPHELLRPIGPALAAQNSVQTPTASPLPGLTLVNDLNSAALNYITLNAGSGAPTAGGLGTANTANVIWQDTGTGALKVRNSGDTAWVRFIDLDETNNAAAPVVPILATASSLSPAPGEHYGEFVATAADTFNLAATSGLWNGFAFAIFAEGANATVAINAADKINGGSAGVGTTVPYGYVGEFRTDGAGNWYVHLQPSMLGAGTLASASTTDLCSVPQQYLAVTVSANTINSFGPTCQAGQIKFLSFSGALSLVESSGLSLPGAKNIVTAAGDTAAIVALGASNFQVLAYQPASGQALAPVAVAPPLFTSLQLSVQSATSVGLSAGFVELVNGGNAAQLVPSVALSIATSLSSSCTVGTANCLDTGSLAASTWYYVWDIFNPTTSTNAGLLSASATAPTLPSGYTYKERLGAVRTGADTRLMATRQYGREAQYVVGGVNVSALPIAASGSAGSPTTPTWVAVATGNFVPPTAGAIDLILTDNVSGDVAMVAPNSSYGAEQSTTNPPVMETTGTSGGSALAIVRGTLILESTNFYWAASGGGAVAVIGWRDNL